MTTNPNRLTALRAELSRQSLDGFIVPLTDEHMSEYVGAYAHRLAWLTGFEGSAGNAVVLKEKAAIFVDFSRVSTAFQSRKIEVVGS